MVSLTGVPPGSAPAALEVGSIVWERADAEADHQRRGGMVVDVARDETTGTEVLVVAVCGTAQNRPTITSFDITADRIDDALTQPPSTTNRLRTARHICAALGARKTWREDERAWLGRAVELASEAWASTSL